MTEREEFENKKVFLWGHKQASKKLLKEFDKGDQNPTKRRVRQPRQQINNNIPVIRRFKRGDNYGVEDLEFLNREYERLDNELGQTNDLNDMRRLEDEQEALYDLIEGLEAMQRLQGGRINNNHKVIVEKVIEIIQDKRNKEGRGFKKGSSEAIEHARKMREKLNKPVKKEVEKKIDTSKVRVEKGTEKAKSIGQRLTEARKAKAELRKIEEEKKAKEEEEKKANEPPPITPSKGKPYYYIGDIPKGYRPATMLEAIQNKKVSEYGKFIVDSTIYDHFKDYGILINPEPNDMELKVQMMVMKKKTLRELEDIEIFNNKLENPKYEDRKEEFKQKLNNAKQKRKVFNSVYNFYYKIWADRNNKQYQRITFKRDEKPEIKTTKGEELKVHKTLDLTTRKKDEKEKEYYEFGLGNNRITIEKKYFDDDKTLKSKYVDKLMKKGIILLNQYYKPHDIHKYFYIELY